MKIGVVCCTWNRPRELGHLIYCFEQQDHPDREMVILDDAGQYQSQSGDRWRLTSLPRRKRFPTLGAKRNAATWLLSSDVEAIMQWDDDDVYLPWALSATVETLSTPRGINATRTINYREYSVQHLFPTLWSRPSVVFRCAGPGQPLRQYRTWNAPDESDKAFQGGWGYRKDLFQQVGGYPASRSNGEDLGLARRLRKVAAELDPIALGHKPFYIYGPYRKRHLCNMGPGNAGYDALADVPVEPATLRIKPPDVVDIHNPVILPGVAPRMFGGCWK